MKAEEIVKRLNKINTEVEISKRKKKESEEACNKIREDLKKKGIDIGEKFDIKILNSKIVSMKKMLKKKEAKLLESMENVENQIAKTKNK